jgi:hypothetical protein
VISTAAMIPFRIKAVKKVLVEAVFAPLTSDLGGGDERLREQKEENQAYIWDCGGYGGKGVK